MRTVAEAYGGLGAVAAEAGIGGESLYRALSPKGDLTPQNLARRPQSVRNEAFGERGWRLCVNQAVTLQCCP
jgi:hypothetical protein